METNLKLPLVVIVGPTASGKTSLAVEIAKQVGGEIICADSRSVYKYMDIGTAKPTISERQGVPHWGLDLVEPGEYFSVADFKKYADEKIDEIRNLGKIPFLVGGTGLYVDSVVFDYKFGPVADNELRDKLQHFTVRQLQEHCEENGVTLPENKNNKRYLIRAIEVNKYIPQKNNTPLLGCIIVGISTQKEELLERSRLRVDRMLEDGLIQETKTLRDQYGTDCEAMKSNAYSVVAKYLRGEIELDDVKNTLVTLDWQLSKRQMTWMRRNKHILWFSLNNARDYLLTKLVNIEQA